MAPRVPTMHCEDLEETFPPLALDAEAVLVTQLHLRLAAALLVALDGAAAAGGLRALGRAAALPS